MVRQLIHIFAQSAESSFLGVTVFVGMALFVFGFLNYETGGRFIEAIQKHRRWQPVIGAFLGVTPGCGGAIFVMPLFIRGSVSFGTVIATLVATAGDSAFVMISVLPFHFIAISAISFVTAVVTGYIVDYLNLGDRLGLTRRRPALPEELDRMNREADHLAQELACDSIKGCQLHHINHIGHEEGDEIDVALHHTLKGLPDPRSLAARLTRPGAFVYWGILTVGLILGVLLLFQVDINDLGVQNLALMVGVPGTMLSIALVLGEKKLFADDSHEETEAKLMSFRETLVHTAHETAFAGTWVFVAFVIYELAVMLSGGGDYAQGEIVMQNIMTSAGLTAVIIGALVGLVPGCGLQILYVTLFLKGWFPFAALVANAISQDGDALFPLLALDKKSSAWATVITTIPALAVGLALYVLETQTGILDVFKIEVKQVMMTGAG